MEKMLRKISGTLLLLVLGQIIIVKNPISILHLLSFVFQICVIVAL